jgi:hypothetical protein
MLKVCNQCTAQFPASTEECPECLQAGRGSVRDYHFAFEEDATPAEVAEAAEPAATDSEAPPDADETGAVDADNDGIADDDETSEGTLDEEDSDDMDGLDEYSRNHLSRMARERGLDATGSKQDLLARLRAAPQG